MLEEGGNMDHHITKMTEIIDSLAKHGQDVPDTTIVGVLLGSISWNKAYEKAGRKKRKRANRYKRVYQASNAPERT